MNMKIKKTLKKTLKKALNEITIGNTEEGERLIEIALADMKNLEAIEDKAAIAKANATRAGYAAEAIAVFRNTTGTDLEDVICDLICNLMHWCDLNNQNFNDELDRSRNHYEHEIKFSG